MRMFIALELDTSSLKDIKNQLKDINGRFVSEKNFHLTLAFLGDVNINKIEELKNIINSINFDLKEINSKYISTFHKNVVVINFEKKKELMDYQSSLTKLLKEHNIYYDDKPYIPHLTLIRNSSCDIKFNYQKTFKIKAIHLFSSTLDKNGSIYDSLFTKVI